MYGVAYYVCTTPGLSRILMGSFGKHKNPLSIWWVRTYVLLDGPGLT